MTDREVMQMALDALTIFREWEIGQDYNSNRETVLARAFKAEETLRTALAQGEKNEFRPDWDAMAVMVEEQQRLAKKVEEATDALQAALKAEKKEPTECVCGATLYIDANGTPRSDASVMPATIMFKPEPKPVAWGFQNTGITGSNRWMYLRETIPAEDQYRGVLWTPLYATPPQRPWQGLTEQDTLQIRAEWEVRDYRLSELCRAIEAKLKENNS